MMNIARQIEQILDESDHRHSVAVLMPLSLPEGLVASLQHAASEAVRRRIVSRAIDLLPSPYSERIEKLGKTAYHAASTLPPAY